MTSCGIQKEVKRCMYHKILYIYTQCIGASILPAYNGQMIFSDVPLIKITQCVSWSPGVEIVQRLGSPKSLRSFWDPEKKTGIINITNSNKSTIFRENHGKYVWRFVSSLILPKKNLAPMTHGIQTVQKKKQSEKTTPSNSPTASNQRSTGSTAWRAKALADTKRHSFCSRSCCKRLRLPSDPTWDVSDVCFQKPSDPYQSHDV